MTTDTHDRTQSTADRPDAASRRDGTLHVERPGRANATRLAIETAAVVLLLVGGWLFFTADAADDPVPPPSQTEARSDDGAQDVTDQPDMAP